MDIEKRLTELGITLPPVPAPSGNFVQTSIHGGCLWLAGQGPMYDGTHFAAGKVGGDVTVEQAYLHARQTGLVMLAIVRSALGSLDRVQRVLNLVGMVNAVADFTEHTAVINGCSDLFVEIFGESGKHPRVAVGMGSLPRNIPVEISAVFAVLS